MNDSPDCIMMYYLNDGMYGSLNCLLNNPEHSNVEPYLHRVNIDLNLKVMEYGHNCVLKNPRNEIILTALILTSVNNYMSDRNNNAILPISMCCVVRRKKTVS